MTAQQSLVLRDTDLQLRALKCENDRLRERIRTLEKCAFSTPFVGAATAQTSSRHTLLTDYKFTKLNGQCKYMAYGKNLDLVAVSMKPSQGLFEGYAVELRSLYDLKSKRAKILHRQEIKDLCFHPSRPWLLTASLDTCARISEIDSLNLSSVHNFRLDAKIWSCCWSQSKETNFFLGLANGDIKEYDVRQPSEPVHVLAGPTRRPVASLKSFEINALGSRASGKHKVRTSSRSLTFVVPL